MSGEAYAASTSNGYEAKQKIAILEGSWIINDRSYATAKFTDFGTRTWAGRTTSLSLVPALDGSVNIDPLALDRWGSCTIPVPITGQTAFNAFIAPIINRYGYVQDGVSKGGGCVGAGS